jgi:nitrate/nitrite transporter NarK
VLCCAAALITGFLSDYLLKRFGTNRMTVLGIVFLFAAVCFFALGAVDSAAASTPSVSFQYLFLSLLSMIGLAFGATFGVVPSTVGEIYLRNWGKIFSFLQLGAAGKSGHICPTPHVVSDSIVALRRCAVLCAAATLGVPNLTPFVFAQTGDYNALYWTFGALMTLTGVIIIYADPPKYDAPEPITSADAVDNAPSELNAPLL